jgi:DNA polymerase III delta prime subunit
MNTNPNSAFVAKYAPRDLSEVVFADVHVEESIQHYVARGDMRPLILYGPCGTGKSTIARLLSRKLVPDRIDIYEYNSLLSETDPKIGKYILEGVRYGGFGKSGIKVYILDEFESFRPALVRNLKCAIDNPAGHVLFITTTNKIDALERGHCSRSVRLHIVQASLERWMSRIEAIFAAEGVPVPGNRALQKLLDDSKGDNRQFLSDLQRVCEGARPSQGPRCEDG